MNDLIGPQENCCDKTADYCSSGVLADLQRVQKKLEVRLQAVQEAIKALQDNPGMLEVLEKVNLARRLG